MKSRVWLAGAALVAATLAYAPGWVAQAQDSGDKPTKEAAKEDAKAEYDSAKEVLGSFRELAEKFKDQRAPTDEEIAAYFAAAFPRAADYLDAHKDATDRAMIYSWAGRRGAYGYGNEAFVRIAKSYIDENKEAKDLKTWQDSLLFARLGVEAESADAQKELTKLEKEAEAEKDLSRRIELAGIWLAYYGKTNDSEAKAALVKKLSTDEAFAKADDDWVRRRLMRTIFQNSDVKEINDGEAFPDWSAVMPVNALDGKPISTADYKGKVILIDFWATWCGPCMHEMPNVIKLYGETHEQGFEIIGVSFDAESGLDKLNSTIAGKEKVGEMPWRQIYDGGGWGSGLAGYYGIHSIPRTVLIDQQGNVVANGLRGDALAAKVKELLAKNEKKEEGADK